MAGIELVYDSVTALTFGCGSILVAYNDHAAGHGWPRSAPFKASGVTPALGVGLIGWAAYLSWTLGWPHMVLTIAGGFVLSHLAMRHLREFSQLALFVGPAAAIGSAILMRPFE